MAPYIVTSQRLTWNEVNAFAIVATVLCVYLACCGFAVALRRNRAHMRELESEIASLREARGATAPSVPVRLLAFGRGAFHNLTWLRLRIICGDIQRTRRRTRLCH